MRYLLEGKVADAESRRTARRERVPSGRNVPNLRLNLPKDLLFRFRKMPFRLAIEFRLTFLSNRRFSTSEGKVFLIIVAPLSRLYRILSLLHYYLFIVLIEYHKHAQSNTIFNPLIDELLFAVYKLTDLVNIRGYILEARKMSCSYRKSQRLGFTSRRTLLASAR